MKTAEFHDLPLGAEVRGNLYLVPECGYWTGDVLEVELSAGFVIDVGWDEAKPDKPYRIAVYREYYGDRFVEYNVATVDDVVNEVQLLAREYSQPVATFSCAASEPRSDKNGGGCLVGFYPSGFARMAACSTAVILPIVQGIG